MNKFPVFIIGLSFLLMLFILTDSAAGPYTIKLNNGKEITVHKYWDEGKNIRFYMNGGSVGIPKQNIQSIVKESDSSAAMSGGKNFSLLSDSAVTDQGSKDENSQAAAEKQAVKEQVEIREKIAIIKANITTLNERKNNYLEQRTTALDAKLKATGQLDKTRTTLYITSEDLRQSEEIAQRKISDADAQINQADQAITDIDEMLANQETTMKNLENRLR